MSLRDKAAIVGIGQLPFSKNIGRSEEMTALEAAKLALEDAGLRPSDIDGMSKWSIQVTPRTPSRATSASRTCAGSARSATAAGAGAGSSAMPRPRSPRAWPAACSIYRSRNRGSGGRPWAGTSRERDQSQAEGNETAFFSPYGFVRPVDQVAMFARRFLHERGYTTRHLGWIAVSTPQARDATTRWR